MERVAGGAGAGTEGKSRDYGEVVGARESGNERKWRMCMRRGRDLLGKSRVAWTDLYMQQQRLTDNVQVCSGGCE